MAVIYQGNNDAESMLKWDLRALFWDFKLHQHHLSTLASFDIALECIWYVWKRFKRRFWTCYFGINTWYFERWAIYHEIQYYNVWNVYKIYVHQLYLKMRKHVVTFDWIKTKRICSQTASQARIYQSKQLKHTIRKWRNVFKIFHILAKDEGSYWNLILICSENKK